MSLEPTDSLGEGIADMRGSGILKEGTSKSK